MSDIRLRRHTDGRVAIRLGPAFSWHVLSPADARFHVWLLDEPNDLDEPGWSELLVAELPEPGGWSRVAGANGENAQAPYWRTRHGTYTAWNEGVEDDWGLQEDESLNDVRSGALKMLAVVAACERYRSEREKTPDG